MTFNPKVSDLLVTLKTTFKFQMRIELVSNALNNTLHTPSIICLMSEAIYSQFKD